MIIILALVVFLPLHAAVLEPDLDLPLRQRQRMSYLDPSPTRQIPDESQDGILKS